MIISKKLIYFSEHACTFVEIVVIVKTVVMPRATLAAVASWFIQNDTQERIVIRQQGM